jgi:hypothetical protein
MRSSSCGIAAVDQGSSPSSAARLQQSAEELPAAGRVEHVSPVQETARGRSGSAGMAAESCGSRKRGAEALADHTRVVVGFAGRNGGFHELIP